MKVEGREEMISSDRIKGSLRRILLLFVYEKSEKGRVDQVNLVNNVDNTVSFENFVYTKIRERTERREEEVRTVFHKTMRGIISPNFVRDPSPVNGPIKGNKV